MAPKQYYFHNGESGSALAIRLALGAKEDRVIELLDDGTIKIQLVSSLNDKQTYPDLIDFLGKILNTSPSKIELVAGKDGMEVIVSVIDMTAEEVQEKIIENIL